MCHLSSRIAWTYDDDDDVYVQHGSFLICRSLSHTIGLIYAVGLFPVFLHFEISKPSIERLFIVVDINIRFMFISIAFLRANAESICFIPISYLFAVFFSVIHVRRLLIFPFPI